MGIQQKGHKALWIIGAIVLFLAATGVTWALLDRHAPKQGGGSSNTPEPPATPKTAFNCVEELPNSVKIGQKLMFAGYEDQIASQAATFAGADIGGVILMNATSGEAIASFKKEFSIAPFVGVDQEGGTVQRFTGNGVLPGANVMAASQTPQQAYNAYLSDGAYLKNLGITTNFAPVLGVVSASPSPLPGRMYSNDPTVVTTYATQAINAATTAGITPVVKHFPGLGSTTVDTDFGSATTDPLSVLQDRDLIPYKNVASLKPDAMVSNAIVPELTDGQPATWSAAAVNLLRSYGYQDSVVYSDSLTAEAIPGSIDTAVVKAWQAGIDVAMIVQDDEGNEVFTQNLSTILATATAAVESGQVSAQVLNESVLRILNRKAIDPCSISQ